MNCKEPVDIIGFDKISMLNEKLDFPEVGLQNHSNPIAEETFCENFLSLKDTGDNHLSREHPLTLIQESPVTKPQKQTKPTNINTMEEEPVKSPLVSNTQQFSNQVLPRLFYSTNTGIQAILCSSF